MRDWKVETSDGETVLLERFSSGKYKKIAYITSNDWIKVSRGALVSVDQVSRLIEEHNKDR